MDKKLTDRRLKPCKSCLHYKACITANYDMVKKTFECEHFEDKDLINSLQDKNKNLQERNVILGGLVDTQKAENERLESLLERLGDDIDLKLKYIYELEEKLETAKAEAYKEFAERAIDRVKKARQKYQRLCKEQGEEMEEYMHIHFNGITGIINNLLKELVGDNNES
jgi:uncharacterized protein with von Willebrand factor type A (vWA) domain